MPTVVVLQRDIFSWQPAVLDKDLATPPGTPTNGDRYLIAASPTGAWSTHAGHIATWGIPDPVGAPSTFGWIFAIPSNGWYVYIIDENKRYLYNGTAWAIDPQGVGETNTASNVNTTGVGIYKQKTGANLEFRGVKAGSSKVAVVDSTGDNTISVDVLPGALDHNALLNYDVNRHALMTYDSVSKTLTITV